MPIQSDGSNGQQSPFINNTNMPNVPPVPPNLLQRPHTAPSSTEMFRPSSACDIPELSEENLSSMLE